MLLKPSKYWHRNFIGEFLAKPGMGALPHSIAKKSIYIPIRTQISNFSEAISRAFIFLAMLSFIQINNVCAMRVFLDNSSLCYFINFDEMCDRIYLAFLRNRIVRCETTFGTSQQLGTLFRKYCAAH